MCQRLAAPHTHEYGDYTEGRESACFERVIASVTMKRLQQMRIA
jgi:hypothetical protein